MKHHGKIRVYDVMMSGTTWKPELPSKEKIDTLLDEINSINCETEKVLVLMCKLMKMQIFNDGNKRTAMLVANHELIRLGRGVVSIPTEYKTEFGMKLIEYYENEDKLYSLVDFIYDKCLNGINF